MAQEYANIFTIEERKKFISQAIADLRKMKGMSQKEVAAVIGVTQATYSTYERGRTEPPAEIMVRLSYLFDCPVDILMQRDRQYRSASDLAKQMDEYKEKFAEIGKQLAESGKDTPGMSDLLDTIGKLTDALLTYSQTDPAQKAINLPESN